MAKNKGLTRVYVHAFLDGRDVSPTSGKDFVSACRDKCQALGVGKIATVMGRYYAMDRDNRWERVQLAYDAMVYGEGIQNPDPVDAVAQSYANDVTDEFMEPVVCDPEGTISDNDSIIFFNYRPDRARRSPGPLWTRSLTASSGSTSPPPTSATPSMTPPCPTCWWPGPGSR